MTSYEEYAKAFEDSDREAQEKRDRALIAETRDLSRHVGPGLWPETRQRLEDTSRGENPKASSIARTALDHQQEHDYHPAPFEPLNWDEDSGYKPGESD